MDDAAATRRLAVCDGGVRARRRQMFAVDWRDSLLYDLVVDTETVDVMTAGGHVLGLIAKAGVAVGAGGHVRLAGVVGSETVLRRPVR
jgi:cytidylate kinase